MQLITGFLLAALVALAAWKAGSLSRSGAWAAALTGGLIFGLGGLPWATLLLAFFISSSVLSHSFTRRKVGLAEKYSKGNRRDWSQVFANGGLGALLAALYGLFPAWGWLLWPAFAGTMAAVNADTWATEIGVLNPTPPRLITNGRVVERGTSGGISLLGSLAAAGGAGLVALLAAGFTCWSTRSLAQTLVVLGVAWLGGLAGSFFDSLLGATVQAIYHCPACRKETERHPLHLCGAPTTQIRGLGWMNNDVVNTCASMAGALLAGVLSVLSVWLLLVG
jgi:uncharacterized protein (TIGR00297 family)